jgi:zinc protease
MFQHLAYSEADFRTEAGAVLGEYNRNAADPTLKLFEVQRDRFYQVHTYKHTTLGFIEDIENMPEMYDYSKVFFERWYRPQYTTVIVAGDVTAQQVLPLVEKHWGAWKAGAPADVTIPVEPAPRGPIYAHVPWASETLPYVTVAFPAPAFDETSRETAAIATLSALYFGPTSELYKQLVVTEQKVDELRASAPSTVDPSLFTVLARVKRAADAPAVRDAILATFAAARESLVPAGRLAEAKSHDRYSFARGLDSTERIASVTAFFASFRRSYGTVNEYYRTLDALQPADLQAAARKYFTDAGLIVTTLSKDPLPAAVAQLPSLASLKPALAFPPLAAPPPVPSATGSRVTADGGSADGGSIEARLLLQQSVLPQLNVKWLFSVGSAHDPAGKEGLAALTAAMIAEAGSRALTIDQIEAALYPIAASFSGRADKEMTTFTGSVHRDHWGRFFETALPQLVEPGFRADDFRRLKEAQLNVLVQDLRSDNEEELGKERLQTNIFRGTPYGHVALGTVAGINAITLDDVKEFARSMYTVANLTIGVSGDAPEGMVRELRASAGRLPAGPAASRVKVDGRRPTGIEVEILEKDTRSTAISFGFPIAVTRAHPDFAALSVARAWLGEHRLGSGRLFQRIREIRGINYGNYAYIEAFPRGMFQFFPDANIARQQQIFEVWIRPVVPANAHMTLRIAVHELDQLIQNGLDEEQFEATRGYLLNNVYVMTAQQDQQLGYALDSEWYGIGEFTTFMRSALQALTVRQVNDAIRKHLTVADLSIVFVTRDAEGLKRALASDAPSAISYDAAKPAALLAEDALIGRRKLNIAAERIRVTPIGEVFQEF